MLFFSIFESSVLHLANILFNSLLGVGETASPSVLLPGVSASKNVVIPGTSVVARRSANIQKGNQFVVVHCLLQYIYIALSMRNHLEYYV